MAAEPTNSLGGITVGIPPINVVDANGNIITNLNYADGNVTANRIFANVYNYANGVSILANVTGATGPAGATGVTGATGAQGNIGATGAFANVLVANLDANNFSINNAANITANYFVGVATDVQVESVNNNYSYHMAFVTGSGDTTLHMDNDDNLQYNPADGLLTVQRVDTDYLLTDNLLHSNGNPYSIVSWVTAPTANNDPGTAGQAAYDVGGNLYICVDTNTWAKFSGTTSW